MADFLNGLYFSEAVADAGTGDSDAPTSGPCSHARAENLIEIGNASGGSRSLDGIQLWSATVGLLHSFGAGDTVNSGEAATIVGQYIATPPAGIHPSAGDAESRNAPGDEPRAPDTLFLVDTDSGDYITFVTGSRPRPCPLPAGFPGTRQLGSNTRPRTSAPQTQGAPRIRRAPRVATPNTTGFLAGTFVRTKWGDEDVAELRPGDLVLTRNHGLQPLLGVSHSRIEPTDLLRSPKLRPVVIDGGVFGNEDPIHLSQPQCVAITDPVAELLRGSPEVLVRSGALLRNGLARMFIPRQGADYHHLLFQRHELVLSDGVWAESFVNNSAGLNRPRDAANWQMVSGLDMHDIRHDTVARPILNREESDLMLYEIANYGRVDVPTSTCSA